MEDKVKQLAEGGNLQTIRKPYSGEHCLALVENTWLRGVIQGVTDNIVEVYSLDYGVLDLVNCQDLRKIPFELASLPPLAIQCVFDTLNFSFSSVKSIFEQIVNEDKVVTVKFIDVRNKDVAVVQIIDENGKNILD